jgi:hypothetical protein
MMLAQMVPVTVGNLHREYPNGILHQFVDDGERFTGTPATLHPTFYGCYDWHSAVHCHWQLVRAIRLYPDAAFVPAAIAALNRSFAQETIAVELAYVAKRPNFEMPYGMAWLLQLLAELREQATTQANQWRELLTPLEIHAANRFRAYLSRLPHPVRSGLHNQSAFSLALAWDWAQVAGDEELTSQIAARARHFYLGDVNAPLAYEPSGSDFLSPSLAEADLLRRVLPADEFSVWLWGFFGNDLIETLPRWLAPVQVVDPTDGQLAHYAGLNISRAWMLAGIASGLPADDTRKSMLLTLAQQHRELGLPDALHPDYMVAHWAPTFALYLTSNRGIFTATKS